MNPVTGNEILSYTGNAALGLNTEGLQQYGDTDTKALSEGVFNLAYLNMNKNKAIYDQKIKERDDTFKAIAAGQIQLSQVRPEDRPRLMEKLEKVKEIYFSVNGDVKSDPNKYLEFQQAIADFNEADIYAKSRFIEIGKLQAQEAKEVRPDKKQAIRSHVEKMIGQDLYKEVTPYQHQFDFDYDKVMSEKYFPLENIKSYRIGDTDVSEAQTDILKSRLNYMDMYTSGQNQDMYYNIEDFYNNWFNREGNVSEEDLKRKTALVNKKLASINNELGLTETDEKYVAPIQLLKQADGSYDNAGAGNTKPETVWKIALALNYDRVVNSKLNEGYSKIRENDAQAQKAKNEGAAAMIKSKAYADAQRSLGSKYRAQAKAINRDTTPAENFDEVLRKTSTIETEAGNFVTRVDWDNLQENTRKYLGVAPLTAENGKLRFINITPTNLIWNGKNISDAESEKYYQEAVKNGFKGSIIDYLSDVGVEFDYEVIGREMTEEKNKKGVVTGIKTGKQIVRSGRLTSYQNQTKGKTNKNLFLEGDNTPNEIQE